MPRKILVLQTISQSSLKHKNNFEEINKREEIKMMKLATTQKRLNNIIKGEHDVAFKNTFVS